VQLFSFFAEVFDNQFMLKRCKKVCSTQTQQFKLSSKIFFCYPISLFHHLTDFQLIINDQIININYSLFSCVCENFQELHSQGNELSISVSEDYLNCFFSFFDIMKGYSFSYDNIIFFHLKVFIDYLGINSLTSFIFAKYPIPQTISQSLTFISKPYCELSEEHFNQSLLILIQNFNFISFEDLNTLPNSYLLKIFFSHFLKVESEDSLFQLILQMIEKDKNRMILLKTIHFEFVSSHLLKIFQMMKVILSCSSH
jgi:hypothetical protein